MCNELCKIKRDASSSLGPMLVGDRLAKDEAHVGPSTVPQTLHPTHTIDAHDDDLCDLHGLGQPEHKLLGEATARGDACGEGDDAHGECMGGMHGGKR